MWKPQRAGVLSSSLTHYYGSAGLLAHSFSGLLIREFAEETLGLFASTSVDAEGVALSHALMADQLRGRRCALRVVHHLKKVPAHLISFNPHAVSDVPSTVDLLMLRGDSACAE